MRNFEAASKDFSPGIRTTCARSKPCIQDVTGAGAGCTCSPQGKSPTGPRMELTAVVKTTRITVETETLMIVRRAQAALAWCPNCRAVVDVITISESLTCPAATSQFKDWLSIGKLHFWQHPGGPAQICVTSLLQCFELEEVRTFCPSGENPPDHSRRKQT